MTYHRFDLGGGAAILRSMHKILQNQFHRVIAKRVGREGSLLVDNDPEVTGSSANTLQWLNLQMPLFMGFVPNAPAKLVLVDN